MPNLPLTRLESPTAFRRMAFGTWAAPTDPSIHGVVTIRMDAAIDYLRAGRRRHGRRLTTTHLVVAALARGLRQTPEANLVDRTFSIGRRTDVSIGVIVAIPDRATGAVDMSGLTVVDADRKSLLELVDEIDAGVRALRPRDRTPRRVFSGVPLWMMRPFLGLFGFLFYTLNLDPGLLGVERDPFGSIVVSNLASMGVDRAHLPLAACSRAPVAIGLGRIRKAPVVEGERVVPGRILELTATIDHRLIDGPPAGLWSRTVRRMLESPFRHFEEL